jgi:hypothetical protein
LFAVSLGEFATGDVCPLLKVKAKVSTTADPWLPTSTKPSVEEL